MEMPPHHYLPSARKRLHPRLSLRRRPGQQPVLIQHHFPCEPTSSKLIIYLCCNMPLRRLTTRLRSSMSAVHHLQGIEMTEWTDIDITPAMLVPVYHPTINLTTIGPRVRLGLLCQHAQKAMDYLPARALRAVISTQKNGILCLHPRPHLPWTCRTSCLHPLHLLTYLS